MFLQRTQTYDSVVDLRWVVYWWFSAEVDGGGRDDGQVGSFESSQYLLADRDSEKTIEGLLSVDFVEEGKGQDEITVLDWPFGICF